jgi:asparaginyl-tRNA synthetase
MDLKTILDDSAAFLDKDVTLSGWVRNHRKQAYFGFIDFSDGTSFNHLQLVYNDKLESFEEITKIKNGSSIEVTGTIVKSEGAGQDIELKVKTIKILGDCPDDYPMQPKRQTREFLREQAYLRPRPNMFQAVFRVRSVAAFAIHRYFQENGYIYFHAPIITASDCEGAGEMFRVTTLDMNNVPKTEEGKIDFKKDFFGKEASLTVSGQLEAETFALAYKKVYTFGPTFRAENSNTKTHASEFWMIEPEIAFCDLNGDMEVMESMLKYVVRYVLDNCKDEMKFFDDFVEKGIIEKLEKVVNTSSVKITHKEAIDILINSGVNFENKPTHGEDLATEHEKYLTGEHFHAPVFVKDWPKDIKAFYMKLNDDNKTVAAVDLLVPGAGELMGGSQREERLDVLRAKMKDMNIPEDGMEWYMNLRKYGGCIHSGFGMGFERLLIYLTGVDNIRDVVPYPRTPKNCEF